MKIGSIVAALAGGVVMFCSLVCFLRSISRAGTLPIQDQISDDPLDAALSLTGAI